MKMTKTYELVRNILEGCELPLQRDTPLRLLRGTVKRLEPHFTHRDVTYSWDLLATLSGSGATLTARVKGLEAHGPETLPGKFCEFVARVKAWEVAGPGTPGCIPGRYLGQIAGIKFFPDLLDMLQDEKMDFGDFQLASANLMEDYGTAGFGMDQFESAPMVATPDGILLLARAELVPEAIRDGRVFGFTVNAAEISSIKIL